MTEQELDKRLMTLRIIWFALLMSLGVYLLVAIQFGTNVQSSINEEALGIRRTVLYAMAFAIFIATRYVRKLIMSGKNQVSQPAQSLEQLALQKYSAATIVALAMSESIGISGLILFSLGKNSTDLYLLTLISAVAMVVYRPRKDEMLHLVQRGPVDSVSGSVPDLR
jgi:drug/metabolite transporter (DMT)-like permease